MNIDTLKEIVDNMQKGEIDPYGILAAKYYEKPIDMVTATDRQSVKDLLREALLADPGTKERGEVQILQTTSVPNYAYPSGRRCKPSVHLWLAHVLSLHLYPLSTLAG